jgi:hypothetical protein
MAKLPDPAWKKIASLSNADVYEVRGDVIAICPHQDAVDDADSARESLTFQREHWTRRGKGGAVIVHMDPMREQTMDARGIYTNEAQSAMTTCFALVGESFYAMAVSAVFTGLAKPSVPTNIFRSVSDAESWIREVNRPDGNPSDG